MRLIFTCSRPRMKNAACVMDVQCVSSQMPLTTGHQISYALTLFWRCHNYFVIWKEKKNWVANFTDVDKKLKSYSDIRVHVVPV